MVSPPVLSVVELFKGPLAGMRFADVDADGLASLVAKVDAAGVEVAGAEAKLRELRQVLAELVPPAESVEARAVELDSEPTDASEARFVLPVRKSRRGSSAASKSMA